MRSLRVRSCVASVGLICTALGAVADVERIAVDLQPWYVAEDRAIAREVISPRNSRAESMSIAEIVVPPGVEVTPHHHLMEEVYHVLEGEGVVMVEDELTVVKVGDSVVIRPHEWHNVRNEGEVPLRMHVTCVPAWAPEHLVFKRKAQPAG